MGSIVARYTPGFATDCRPSVHHFAVVPARLVPESEFDPIPKSKLVVDDAEVVFDDVLSRADGFCDLTVLESLGNECNDPQLSFVRDAWSVELPSKHRFLRDATHDLPQGSRIVRKSKITRLREGLVFSNHAATALMRDIRFLSGRSIPDGSIPNNGDKRPKPKGSNSPSG